MNKISIESLQTQLFTYEDITEYNNFKMISGYENNINYEGIEVKEAMHIIIYNTVTNEIIYQTGSNTRLDLSILIQYAETLLKLVNKYINDSWNLNKLMDQFFYEFKFIQFSKIKKQFDNEELQLQKQIEDNAINKENTELENKLNELCINKELKLAKCFTRLYIIDFKDKRCNKTLSSNFIIDELLDSERFKNEYKIIYSNDNTSNIKNYNIALKEAIKEVI